LGDITGVVYYENADYLFRYAYDAYGNYELVPPDDSVAAEIMATIFHALNPLTYRGYIFTPAIGISHYLGSRFYVPQLCRFMNADIYCDTLQGVIGTNMFAYCNNNPIMFIDPEGTNTDTHQPLGLPEFFLALFMVFKELMVFAGISTGILISIAVINEFAAYVDVCIDNLFNDLKTHINSKLSKLEDDFQKVMDDLIEKFKKIKKKKNYKTQTEKHHICAKGAKRALKAKQVLYDIGSSPDQWINLIDLYTVVHRHLHTNAYYAVTNTIVVTAFEVGDTDEEKTLYVLLAIFSLRAFLEKINGAVEDMFPYLI